MFSWIERRSRFATLLGPVLAAVAISYLFDVGFLLARRHTAHPGYLLFCALAMAAAAFLLCAVVALAGATARQALACWAATNGFLSGGAVGFAGFGIAAWLVLGLREDGRRSDAALGLAVGAAICVSVILWPRVGKLLAILPDSGFVSRSSASVVFGVALLAIARGVPALAPTSRGAVPIACAGLLAIPLAGAAVLSPAPGRVSDVPPRRSPAGEGTPPSVLVLVLDTVRADHLSVYGYFRDTTPALDAFLRNHPRATLYPLAFAPSTWTLPSHASLFTGELPSTHGVHSGTFDLFGSLAVAKLIARMTLAELLAARGYETGAILANPHFFRVDGIARGFDVFVTPPSPHPLQLAGERLRSRFFPDVLAYAIQPYADARTINSEVLQFIESRGDAPFFLVANYMEAHTPYAPRAEYRGRFREDGRRSGTDQRSAALLADEARYDEEIRALDAELGRLLEELDRSGILERSWLFVTADHGESFGEHGARFHGTAIYNEQVRIPLIVHPPAGIRVPPRSHAVSLLDIPTTIARIAGAPSFGIGHDLRADEEPYPSGIEFFGSLFRNTEDVGELATQPARAVVQGERKLIERAQRLELYELADDPFEQRNRATTESEVAARLARALPPLTSRPSSTREPERPLSVDQHEQLRALGYVQ